LTGAILDFAGKLWYSAVVHGLGGVGKGPAILPKFISFNILFLATTALSPNNPLCTYFNRSSWTRIFQLKTQCTVKYASIDDAVKIIQNLGKNALLAKCDIKSAFRLLRISPTEFDLTGFKFKNEYYFDKFLPMGASISCALFETNCELI
jgi:hypothetical protein